MWLADSVRENRKSAPAKVFIKMVYLQKVGVWVYVYGCEIPIIGNFKLRRKCSKEKSEGHCKLVFFWAERKQTDDAAYWSVMLHSSQFCEDAVH